MPIHSLSTAVNDVSSNSLFYGAAGVLGLVGLKAWSGGRRCTWEREWAGKMILIVAPPTPPILSHIDSLLRLPSPPQILFLPPIPSPLPASLLTIIQTLRLSSTSPSAQLHCDPLPRTPAAIREFVTKWSTVPQGMAGEGGRRIDAILLGSGFEVEIPPTKADGAWTLHEYHFHFLTALLPHLLRQPAERNIRIVHLVSPVWTAALPTLEGKAPRQGGTIDGKVQITASRSITTLLMMRHFQLVLDTLASAQHAKGSVVPTGEDEGSVVPGAARGRKRDESVKSNIMTVGVVMPWTRGEVVRGVAGADQSWWRLVLFVLLYPIIMIFAPSPRMAVQSILFALFAPVRYGSLDEPRPLAPIGAEADEQLDPRQAGVQGGDVVRNCAVIDLPPVMHHPDLCKITYDALEQSVEQGVKAAQAKEKKAQAASKQ